MECIIHDGMDYLNIPAMISAQRLFLTERIRGEVTECLGRVYVRDTHMNFLMGARSTYANPGGSRDRSQVPRDRRRRCAHGRVRPSWHPCVKA